MVDLNKEILKYVIDQLEKEKKTSLSKIAIQKLIFFLREAGIPVTYDFEFYSYGPYSKGLNNDADELIFWSELKWDKDGYKKGEKFKVTLAIELKDEINKKIEELKSLADYNFNDFDSMELLGIIFYCIRALQEVGIDPNFENVQKEFIAWKGNKYSKEKLQQVYDKVILSTFAQKDKS